MRKIVFMIAVSSWCMMRKQLVLNSVELKKKHQSILGYLFIILLGCEVFFSLAIQRVFARLFKPRINKYVNINVWLCMTEISAVKICFFAKKVVKTLTPGVLLQSNTSWNVKQKNNFHRITLIVRNYGKTKFTCIRVKAIKKICTSVSLAHLSLDTTTKVIHIQFYDRNTKWFKHALTQFSTSKFFFIITLAYAWLSPRRQWRTEKLTKHF